MSTTIITPHYKPATSQQLKKAIATLKKFKDTQEEVAKLQAQLNDLERQKEEDRRGSKRRVR